MSSRYRGNSSFSSTNRFERRKNYTSRTYEELFIKSTPPDFNWNFHGKQTTFPTISPSAPNVNFPLFFFLLPETKYPRTSESNQCIEQRTKGKISPNKEAEWVYREYIKAVCFFNRESLAIFPAGQKFSRNSIVLKYAEVNVAVD